jgi:hypothetical protein
MVWVLVLPALQLEQFIVGIPLLHEINPQLTCVNLLQKHSIQVQIKGRVNGAIAPGLPAISNKNRICFQ